MAHKYNPLQARDARGRWVAKAGNAAFSAATKSVGTGKKAGPIKVVSIGRGARPATFSQALGELGRNTIPYVRFNKRSQTAGVNAGARIPYTHKRVVFGGYSRLESTRNKTAVDRLVAKGVTKVFPGGTRRGKVLAKVKAANPVVINNPAIRATVRGHQVRLGTSRGAGPTIIIRRGKHKTGQAKSQVGVQKYDTQMRKIAGAKAKPIKHRAQRRKAAQKRRAKR